MQGTNPITTLHEDALASIGKARPESLKVCGMWTNSQKAHVACPHEPREDLVAKKS
jgi:hypothetical protein